MSTIHGTTKNGAGNPKATILQSPKAWRNAFQQWRKRERRRTELGRLTDSELMDIGITRGEIDHVSNHSISSDPLRWMSDIGTRI